MKAIIKFLFLTWFAAFWASAAEQKKADQNSGMKDLNISYDDFKVVDQQEKSTPPPGITKPDDATSPQAEKSTEAKPEQDAAGQDFINQGIKTLTNLRERGTNIISNVVGRKPQEKYDTLPQSEPEEKVDTTPDPFFYDAVYNKQSMFITYAYIYNDKTNKDNLYIPRTKQYNIMYELFKILKTSSGNDKFHDLYNLMKENKTFDQNVVDKNGNTMLLTAMRNGNFEILQFLLLESANPNICNNFGICPIQMAVFSSNVIATKLLCDADVDIKIKDRNHMDIIRYTMYHDMMDVFDIVLDRYLRYPVNAAEREDLITFAQGLKNDKFQKALRYAFEQN